MFENKGEVVGVSNPHPHCQIYATNFVFKTIENEAAISRRYWDENRRVLMEDIIAGRAGRRAADPQPERLGRGVRSLFRPLRLRDVRGTHGSRTQAWPTSRPKELRDLAAVLQEVLIRFDNLWTMSFPYVMALHQAPTDGRRHEGFHFHIEFHPPLAQAEPAEVPGRAGDRRRQLPQRHVAGGEGRRASGRVAGPLQADRGGLDPCLNRDARPANSRSLHERRPPTSRSSSHGS